MDNIKSSGISQPGAIQSSLPQKSKIPPKMKTPSGQAPEDTVSLSKDKKKWTVLMYIDGDNNLAPLAKRSMKAVQTVGSDENVNVVAQLAIQGVDARRGRVIKVDKKENTGEFIGAANVGPKDMGDPGTLKDFLKWGMKKYPADHYALVMWDHGAGYIGSMSDDGPPKTLLKNQQLAEVLEDVKKENEGKPIDVVNFNACLMAQAEVAYELKDGAKYLVGSEETEAGLVIPIPNEYGTTPQHKVLADLQKGIKEKGDIAPDELARLYVFESKHQLLSQINTVTQSAIDLSKIGDVAESADTLARSILDAIARKPELADRIRDSVEKTQHYAQSMPMVPYDGFRDLAHFAEVLEKDKKLPPEINLAAKDVRDAVKNSIVAEHHHSTDVMGNIVGDSHGLSVYLPTGAKEDASNIKYYELHKTTGFAKETKWDEMMEAISGPDKLTRFLKKRGLSDKQINACKIGKTILAGAGGGGIIGSYFSLDRIFKAVGVLGGETGKIGAFGLGFAVLQGSSQAIKGGRKVAHALKNDWKISEKAKFVAENSLDIAGGLGTIGFAVAMTAGLPALALPAAGVMLGAMGIKLAKGAIKIAAKYISSKHADRMEVSKKLAETPNLLNENEKA